MIEKKMMRGLFFDGKDELNSLVKSDKKEKER